jgi:hypothetical protein
MSPKPSSPDPAPPSSDAQAPAAPDAAPRRDGAAEPHPSDPAHDLSDSPVHARSPDAYTEPPGSHRRDPAGPALDVGA